VKTGVYDSDGISVVGGDDGDQSMDTVSEYSFTRKEWMKERVKLNHGVYQSAAVIIEGRIYRKQNTQRAHHNRFRNDERRGD